MTFNLKIVLEETGNKTYSGVVHIGAHLGECVEEYSKHGIRHAFWIEANIPLMKSLYDNTKFHPIRSQYMNACIGGENNEELVLLVTKDSKHTSLLQPNQVLLSVANSQIISKMPVLTKRFDTLYREHNTEIDLTKFDLVRISTNGTELSVLQGFGSLLRNFPFRTVCVSVYDQETFIGASQVEDVDSLLNQYGFIRVLSAQTNEYKSEVVYTR